MITLVLVLRHSIEKRSNYESLRLPRETGVSLSSLVPFSPLALSPFTRLGIPPDWSDTEIILIYTVKLVLGRHPRDSRYCPLNRSARLVEVRFTENKGRKVGLYWDWCPLNAEGPLNTGSAKYRFHCNYVTLIRAKYKMKRRPIYDTTLSSWSCQSHKCVGISPWHFLQAVEEVRLRTSIGNCY